MVELTPREKNLRTMIVLLSLIDLHNKKTTMEILYVEPVGNYLYNKALEDHINMNVYVEYCSKWIN